MKFLQLKFKKDGFNFNQIKRYGNIVMYKKTMPKTTIENWEVCYVQSHGDFFVKDKKKKKEVKIEAAECLPSSNTWGNLGWSYQNEDDAFEKFNELMKKL